MVGGREEGAGSSGHGAPATEEVGLGLTNNLKKKKSIENQSFTTGTEVLLHPDLVKTLIFVEKIGTWGFQLLNCRQIELKKAGKNR